MNNFPAMTEAQRQELIQFNRAIIAQHEAYAVSEAGWPDDVRLLVSSARIALAALTAKPKHYAESSERRHGEPMLYRCGTDYTKGRAYYTAPPAPVLRVPDELKVKNGSHQSHIDYAEGWADCIDEVKRLNAQPSPPEASNEQ